MTATVLAVSLAACSSMRLPLPGRDADRTPGLVGAAEPQSLSDEEIERRLAFITERLDNGRRHAAYWQYGWLAVNGGGTIVSGVQAGFDGGNDQAYDIAEAGKSLIGTVYLLVQPMPGRDGAAPIRSMPDATHADRIARLLRAEEMLRATAVRSRERTSWLMHGGNIGLNLVTGAILLGLGAPDLAAMSFFLDTAMGEVQIWTQPWQPRKDWEEYQRFVAGGQAGTPRGVSFRVAPTTRGAALLVKF